MYGRKIIFILSTFITFYFGALFSVAPTFVWVLILRTLVGVGAGKSWKKIKKLIESKPTIPGPHPDPFLNGPTLEEDSLP